MFKKILLFLMCAAITSGVVITTGCTFTGNAEIKESVGEITDETGKNLNDGVIHDLPIQLLFNPRALSNEAEADTAMKVTLRATITPENATNKAVDWSVSFVNASSSWASGKTVTDYVTITPTEDGSLIAEVECKEAFGEQIKITVVSRDNPEAVAECTVDYKQKFSGYKAQSGFYNATPPESKHLNFLVKVTNSPVNSFYIYAVGSTVYTIEMTKSDCVLGSKVVYEYSNELNNALSAINATWSENIKPYVIAESDDKIRTRFNFSDYFFNSSLIEDKFSTEESKNEYYKALYSLANSSKIIVGAVTAKVYDNNDNYLCCIYIDLDLKNVPQVTTVESVSIDNDNITM